jgi:3-oxoacyl-[acyl-carrier protein] reductase
LLRVAHAGNAAITCLEQDLGAAGAAERVLNAALSAFGSLDILVNNAGMRGARTPIADMQDVLWHQVINVNLDAMMRLTRAAIPSLRASRAGRIINLSSTLGTYAVEGLGPYITSKHGVIGLTRTLALELGRYGITANYIAPGMVVTGQTRDYPKERLAEVVRDVAIGRLGEPEEIAPVALFLAEEEASYVNGQGICVDGGWTAKR